MISPSTCLQKIMEVQFRFGISLGTSNPMGNNDIVSDLASRYEELEAFIDPRLGKLVDSVLRIPPG